MNRSPLLRLSMSNLKGVGKITLEKLARANIYTYQDLLLHLPIRYEDRSRFTPLSAAIPETFIYIRAEIISQRLVYSQSKKKMLLCLVSDGIASITLRFMHVSQAIQKSLMVGSTIYAFGQVKRGKTGLELIHPDYQIRRGDKQEDIVLAPYFSAVYPTVEGIAQRTWRKLIKQVLQLIACYPVMEVLPTELGLVLPSFEQALSNLHQPVSSEPLARVTAADYPARTRLVVEELLAHQVSMLLLRQKTQTQQALPLRDNRGLVSQFIQRLPYQLTTAQQRVVDEIQFDLAQNRPMMRLLQGDVGSGKTVVAALASLLAIGSQQQVVLMAPTEILAEQHVDNFRHWFEPLQIRVGWLAGKQRGVARREQIAAIRSGEVDIIIGTHAIFQEAVEFHSLSLIIIDEQHRFGVQQRLELWKKGQRREHCPHQLIMSATPIPRTLAMAAYAQLDISVIDALPPGRTPITTVVLPDSKRLEVIKKVKQVCLVEQRQVYWVCTLIEESEVLEAQAAEDIVAALAQLLPELRIGLVHGRMKAEQKRQTMAQFSAAELDILVATTVIEVGVDVPNATVMVIENAERLGLAQLHQLRGRVGRGHKASHCLLLYQTPLNQIARQRLQIMRENQDGFIIAEQDLQLRGAGELLGTRQTGLINFKVVDLVRDQAWLPQVNQFAKLLLQNHFKQAECLQQRWLPHATYYTQA